MELRKITDLKNVRHIEIYRIQWTSRVWGLYVGGDDLEQGTNL
jgi:hypothetical protein